jgi:hypothetical protein
MEEMKTTEQIVDESKSEVSVPSKHNVATSEEKYR